MQNRQQTNTIGVHCACFWGVLLVCKPSLPWRHNGCDGCSNHQPHDCLLNRSFRRRSKKTSKLLVTGLCAVNSSVTGEFPAQMASNVENVSIWLRHHAIDRHNRRTLCMFLGCSVSMQTILNIHTEIVKILMWCVCVVMKKDCNNYILNKNTYYSNVWLLQSSQFHGH